MKNIEIYKDKRFYAAFPDVERLQNGDLIVIFREAPQRKPYSVHIDSESRNVLIRSKDNGKTWGEKVIVFVGDGFQDPSVTQLKDGTLLANSFKWHVVKKEPFNHWVEGTFVARSLDNGYTWEEPVKVEVPNYGSTVTSGSWVATTDSILELPNGELLIPLYGKRHPSETWNTFVLKSADKGKTWRNFRQIAFDPFGSLNFEEPNLCCLPSGKILCMNKEFSRGYAYYSESLDNGETWSQPKITDILGSPPHLLTLKDGRVLCTYGYKYRHGQPPYGIRACLSYDGGKTWDLRNEIILRNDAFHKDFGYPSAVELEDNQILAVYYFHTKPVNESFYQFRVYRLSEGIRFIAGTFYSLR